MDDRPLATFEMMTGRAASFLFLTVCVVLALPLFLGWVGPSTSSWIFAIALVVLGVLSHGFRRTYPGDD